MLPVAVCRHVPSCSEYASQAYSFFSPTRATFLVMRRLLKCNPFFKGGIDPLPQKNIRQENE
jgi:uncharacterized protein